MSFYTMINQNILFGILIIPFSIYLVSSEGIQVNLNNNTHRNIWSIFAVHIGKWKPNPKFEYISVFKKRQRHRVNFVASSTSYTDEIFLINLFYGRNKYKTFYRTYNKANAFDIAQHFKKALEIDILDATEKKQKWLD